MQTVNTAGGSSAPMRDAATIRRRGGRVREPLRSRNLAIRSNPSDRGHVESRVQVRS
jgi:hypothetical protein